MIETISYSKLNMVLKCGEQYRRRYELGEIIPPNGIMSRGTCGHRALEKNLKQKIQTHSDLPTEEVVQEFVDVWEQEKYKVAMTPVEADRFNGTGVAALDRIKDTGVNLVRVFHEGDPTRKVEAISPKIQPLEVEEKFEVEFEGVPTKLNGIIDTVDVDHVLSDRKFSGKTPSDDDALYDDQLSIYDLGHRVRYGVPATRLEKHFVIDLKSGAKTKIIVAPPREQDQLNRILRRLEAGLKAIETGAFTPAPAGVWWCSPNWCGYWDTCNLHP